MYDSNQPENPEPDQQMMPTIAKEDAKMESNLVHTEEKDLKQDQLGLDVDSIIDEEDYLSYLDAFDAYSDESDDDSIYYDALEELEVKIESIN